MMKRKAQIQLTFNWIYIMIAGAVILLFFVGIVVKQKAVSEENLAVDIVQIMDSIFTGAGASEKTRNVIETGGLADYTLVFDCEERVSSIGIKGRRAKEENEILPLFSPAELKTSRLILWSLPYRLPYKVSDLLFITSINTKYFLLKDDSSSEDFTSEFLDVTGNPDPQKKVNAEKVTKTKLAEIDPGKNFQVRIVDPTGNIFNEPEYPEVPEKVRSMEDDKVTAVSFVGDGKSIFYYQKDGNSWKKLNRQPLELISLGGERDAAKYAAIFAGNAQIYQCNMEKAFQRLELVSEVYKKKAELMKAYYEKHPEDSRTPNCLVYLSGDPEINVEDGLRNHLGNALNCHFDPGSCSGLVSSAQKLKTANQNLGERGDCLTLY